MKILALILLLVLIYILIKKLTKTNETFTNLLNFDSINQAKMNAQPSTTTVYLEEYDTDSFHPKFVIANNMKLPYLFINDFWEMYNLDIKVQDKNKNVVSTINHQNYNIYTFYIDGIQNKIQFINKSYLKFILTSKEGKQQKEFHIKDDEIIYVNESIGTVTNEDTKSWKIEIMDQYNKYLNSIAIAYMIYLQLLKEHSQISI
jgi:hypothetical protein